MNQTIVLQLIWNYLSVEIIQLLKQSKSPALAWISAHTPWVNRIAAVVVAAATTAGFAYTFSTTSGSFAMTVNIYIFAKALLANWVGIKVLYKILYQPVSLIPVLPAKVGAKTS